MQEVIKMRIGAYQFEVTGDEEHNYECIREGIEKAAASDVRLLQQDHMTVRAEL